MLKLLFLLVWMWVGCDNSDKDNTTNTNEAIEAENLNTEDMMTDGGTMENPDGMEPMEDPVMPTIARKFVRQVIDADANGPAFADVADLNNDGKLDLIVSKFGALEGSTIQPGTISIYLQGDDLNSWTHF